MNVIKSSFLSACALFLIGCSGEINFNDESFGAAVVLSGEVHRVDVPLRSDDMCVVHDSLIVVNNIGNLDSMFMVVNGSDWSIKRVFGSRKEGYIKPSIVKNRVNPMVYDQMHNRLSEMSVTGEVTHLPTGLSGEDISSNVSCSGLSYIYQHSPFLAAGRIVKLENYKRTEIVDFTPQFKSTKTPYGYYGTIALNKRLERIAYAYKYVRRLDIYSTDGEVISINCDSNAPSIVRTESGNVSIPNSKIYYQGISTSSERIYLYYIGQSANEIKGSSDLVTFVEEFDWDGNPIKRYQLEEVYSAVSYLKDSFVAVSSDVESQFVVYPIK